MAVAEPLPLPATLPVAEREGAVVVAGLLAVAGVVVEVGVAEPAVAPMLPMALPDTSPAAERTPESALPACVPAWSFASRAACTPAPATALPPAAALAAVACPLAATAFALVTASPAVDLAASTTPVASDRVLPTMLPAASLIGAPLIAGRLPVTWPLPVRPPVRPPLPRLPEPMPPSPPRPPACMPPPPSRPPALAAGEIATHRVDRAITATVWRVVCLRVMLFTFG